MKRPLKKTKPNGKASDGMDLLAKAMRQALQDSVEAGLIPVREDIKGIKDNLELVSSAIEDTASAIEDTATKEDIDTTNKNMQAQFAEQEKKIGKLLGKRL